MALARTKLTLLPCARNSQTKAKGALNNVMDPNIYLNAIVSYRLAQRNQMQKAVPEPEFRRFDLTYLTGAPGKRDHSRNTSRPGEARQNLSDALPA
jgi:hypothetical protein